MVGIDGMNNDYYVNLFSNPSSESIIIHGKVPVETADLRIFNLLGEEVMKMEKINSEFTVKIGVDELPPSLYLLEISSESFSLVKKIIVSR